MDELIILDRQIDELIQNPGQVRQQRRNIIRNIERKAYQAFNQQERINTLAIIDKAWSQDLSSWERKYRLCLGLPGVLLSLGLLGTFLGITINLFILGIKFNSASQIVVEDLQQALGGMAIAFASSLLALGCNVGLTVYRPSHNITLKKEELISSLEFYIDNVYIPGLQPRRPMFHEAVGELRQIVNNDLRSLVKNDLPNAVAGAVSSSLRQNIQEINDDQKKFVKEIHKEVQDLIKQTQQIHIKIEQSSTLIEQGAEHLRDAAQHASDTLESGSKNFENAAKQASASLESATANLQGVQGQYSQSAASLSASAQSLSTSVQSIEDTMASLQSYAKELKSLGEAVRDLNQRSQEILRLAQNNQQAFSPITDQLKQAVRDLQNIANSVNQQLSHLITTLEAQVGNNSKELRDLAGQTQNLAQRLNDFFKGFNNP